MELELMNVLNWHIDPVSSISWLLIYLQVQHDFHEKLFKRNPLKKRRFSSFNGPTNEILRISMQSDAQRSKEFLQLFSNAARVKNSFETFRLDAPKFLVTRFFFSRSQFWSIFDERSRGRGVTRLSKRLAGRRTDGLNHRRSLRMSTMAQTICGNSQRKSDEIGAETAAERSAG